MHPLFAPEAASPWSGIPAFWWAVLAAFVLNWLAFIPAWWRRTERFFDLVGGLTFLSMVMLAIGLAPVRTPRAWLLVVLVSIWALRLSLFLFWRIHTTGKDARFNAIKTSFGRFWLTWTLQALWASITLSPAIAAITSGNAPRLDAWALIGALLWAIGFAIEVIADWQKSRFKANPANRGRFIQSGLWAWSRHPNYFGEILLWIGVAVAAAPALQGWARLTLAAPLFVILLLTRVSGIPLLEARADARWGGQPDYEAYKARTPVLIPRKPSAGKDHANS